MPVQRDPGGRLGLAPGRLWTAAGNPWYRALMTTPAPDARSPVPAAPSSGAGGVVRRLSDRVDLSRRFDLPAPKTNPKTGAVVYGAAFAVPGVHVYPWGRCFTPPEVLADPAWLAGMEGIPLVDDDQTDHAEGVTVEEIGDRAVGSVLSAYWDKAQGAVLGRVLIDRKRGLDNVAAGRIGLSVAYDADIIEEAGEYNGETFTHRQIRRYNAHNVAQTENPRHAVTRLQDSTTGENMKPNELIDKILAAPTRAEIAAALADAKAGDSEGEGMGGLLMTLLDRLLASESGRMASDAKYADMKAKYDAMQPPTPDADPAAKAEGEEAEAEMDDADPEEMDVQPVADALALAAQFGVTPAAGMKLGDLRKAVLVAAGVKNADALGTDAARAVLDTLASTPRPLADAWDRVAAGAKQTPLTPTPAADPRADAFT